MSTHKQPMTDLEREGLQAHGLAIESPSQLSDAFRQGMAWSERHSAKLKAQWQAEGAKAIRHLTQGDDWEDNDLRAVIDDYIAGLRRQAEKS